MNEPGRCASDQLVSQSFFLWRNEILCFVENAFWQKWKMKKKSGFSSSLRTLRSPSLVSQFGYWAQLVFFSYTISKAFCQVFLWQKPLAFPVLGHCHCSKSWKWPFRVRGSDFIRPCASGSQERASGVGMGMHMYGEVEGYCLPPCTLRASKIYISINALGWHLLVGEMGSFLLQSTNAKSVIPPW